MNNDLVNFLAILTGTLLFLLIQFKMSNYLGEHNNLHLFPESTKGK